MASRRRNVGPIVAQIGQLGAQDNQLGSIFGSKLSHLGPFQKPVKTSYQEKNEKKQYFATPLQQNRYFLKAMK